MILCLDVGNTNIFGGLYNDDKLVLQFRYPSISQCTSDQLGVFLKAVLRENYFEPPQVKKVAICSVVPSLNYSIRSAFLKYFSLEALFLQASTVAEFTATYHCPMEMGADRLSAMIAATQHYPKQNIIIVDIGTATTFDAISAQRRYLGGAIMPGILISMKALCDNTAQLFAVHIVKPDHVIGKTTITHIQSGLYYSHLGAIREIVHRMSQSAFANDNPIIIGTGGFAYLFTDEKIFTDINPELVLQGLRIAVQYHM